MFNVNGSLVSMVLFLIVFWSFLVSNLTNMAHGHFWTRFIVSMVLAPILAMQYFVFFAHREAGTALLDGGDAIWGIVAPIFGIPLGVLISRSDAQVTEFSRGGRWWGRKDSAEN